MGYRLSFVAIFLLLAVAIIAGCSMNRTFASPVPPPTSAPSTAIPTTIQTLTEPDVMQKPFGVWREAVPYEVIETLNTITSVDIPQRDLIELTLRLNDPGKPIPQVVRTEPWGFEIGDVHEFWVEDKETSERFQVAARLAYKTAHTYFFVEEGVNLNKAKLKRLADRFERMTYPTNRAFFGEEWSPGVDNDPHLTILLVDSLGVYYQNSMDEYSRLINKYSNEMEIIYIDLHAVESGNDCILAHEFQHMIQWAVDPSEQTWMNEGFSELACPLNGLRPWYVDLISDAFTELPDTQLNAWSGELSQAATQLGASYLFMTYFMDRFGERATHALVAHPKNGVDSLDAVLQSLDAGIGFDDVFADWVVANYLNDPSLAEGQYGYHVLNLPPFEVEADYSIQDLPIERRVSVGQYATDYITMRGLGTFQVDFAGSTLVGLAPISAYSGKYVWWGGRGTNGDTMLTREFDLTELLQATLTFYTWYDIENAYDYAYVEVSTDGEHWTTLPGQTTTNDDPNDSNYGNGFTGVSDGWIQEKFDLRSYIGQRVKIRFEYLTDDGPTHAGIFLDDIEIPELNYSDDAESSDGGWVAHGFTRNTIALPQEWLVQLIMQRQDRTTVERLQLTPENNGRWAVDLDSGERAILVISGRTRVTSELAGYWYRITTSEE